MRDRRRFVRPIGSMAGRHHSLEGTPASGGYQESALLPRQAHTGAGLEALERGSCLWRSVAAAVVERGKSALDVMDGTGEIADVHRNDGHLLVKSGPEAAMHRLNSPAANWSADAAHATSSGQLERRRLG